MQGYEKYIASVPTKSPTSSCIGDSSTACISRTLDPQSNAFLSTTIQASKSAQQYDIKATINFDGGCLNPKVIASVLNTDLDGGSGEYVYIYKDFLFSTSIASCGPSRPSAYCHSRDQCLTNYQLATGTVDSVQIGIRQGSGVHLLGSCVNTIDVDLYFTCENAVRTPSYLLVTQSLSFVDARDYCRQQIGTDLASIHSEAQNIEALQIADSQNVWIGLSTLVSQTWPSATWTDGSLFDYGTDVSGGKHPWWDSDRDEPSGSGGAGNGCTYMWAPGWNDVSCSTSTYYFLCAGMRTYAQFCNKQQFLIIQLQLTDSHQHHHQQIIQLNQLRITFMSQQRKVMLTPKQNVNMCTERILHRFTVSHKIKKWQIFAEQTIGAGLD